MTLSEVAKKHAESPIIDILCETNDIRNYIDFSSSSQKKT